MRTPVVVVLGSLAFTGCGHSVRHESGDPSAGASATGAAAGFSGAGGDSAGGTDAVGGKSAAGGASGAAGAGAIAGSGGAAGEGALGGAAGASASGGASGSGDSGGAPVATVDISGNWAMFGFEDPVAVSLSQSDTELSGTGCCGGLMTTDGFDCCSPISGGSIVGRQVKFAFVVELAPGLYAVDGFASADGTRMAGAFHDLNGWGHPKGWLRLAPGENWLPAASAARVAEIAPRSGSFVLTPRGNVAVGIFSPGQDYPLYVRASGHELMVFGALGAFWHTELSWNEGDQTLSAGPVVETDPSLPTELRLRFDDSILLDVAATLPSGETVTFSSVPR